MKNTKKHLLLPLFLMAAMVVFAQPKQKFSVVSFEELPLDMTAREDGAKDDGTGSLYAIIKVTSTNPDDDLRAYNFDFNYLKHVVEAKDGELWVYVQRNAKHVNISREGFHPLRNYDLRTTIQAGKVYCMHLSPEAKKVQRQFLLFEITPANSEAIITFKNVNESGNEKPFANGVIDHNGRAAMSLELGQYSYRIISKNYHPTEGLVNLSTPSGKHVEKVSLRANFANVTLNSAPDVDIYINEEKLCTGSWNGILSPGIYSVECRKEAHKSSYETMVVKEGENLVVQLPAPTPITGTLSLISSPLGAKISIDGKPSGETPDFIENLLIGKHTVKISLPGYRTETLMVEIRDGETVEHNVTLVIQRTNETPLSVESVGGREQDSHESVDLGLPSGIKWATCNVGANATGEYGDFYAWGETEVKGNYKENNSRTYKNEIDDIAGNPQYDVARAKWGGNWRLPTKAEFAELLDKANCIWLWTTQGDVKGYKVTSKKNGNSIFLPAAGYALGTSLYRGGARGCYWSSTPDEIYSARAYYLYFSDADYETDYSSRVSGRSVRPVCE